MAEQSYVRGDLPPIAATLNKVLKSDTPGGISAPGVLHFGLLRIMSMLASRTQQVCMCSHWRPPLGERSGVAVRRARDPS
jgi:hypothetical protein